MNRHFWTPAEVALLRQRYATTLTADLAAELADVRAAQAEAKPAPVLHPVDIYDFAGWLTTRPGKMDVGSSCEAGPMAEAIGEYLRAYPERFQAAPAAPAPAQAQQPLTWDQFVAACEAEYGEDFAPEEFMQVSEEEQAEIMRVARMLERAHGIGISVSKESGNG
jgi:hypothetical protein